MVRPSNPKLMARVLDAVTHLAEGKGSRARDVLDFVKRNSSGPKRNLTMQVRRALKHAVNAGLLRFKSGRYKMQLVLNPISRHQHHRHEVSDTYEKVEPLEDSNEDPSVSGTDLSRRVQDRRKRPSRRKRAVRKARKRSATRSARRKITKHRTASIERRARKVNKRVRRKNNDKIEEDWPTRRRRMMMKSSFDADDEVNADEDEEEDEEEMRDTMNSPKIKGVNEDSASNVSGDSGSVGRHRSRRSKHLANDRRSPSRRGNGDSEGPRKSTRRSTSRRRSQQRHRENRRESAPEEIEDERDEMDGVPGNEGTELEDYQGDIERVRTPPKNQGNE